MLGMLPWRLKLLILASFLIVQDRKNAATNRDILVSIKAVTIVLGRL